MAEMPFTVTTATGDKLEFAFPLHSDTASPVRVSQLLTAILAAVDREIRTLGDTANGDVLQAVAMTLAARAAMIRAPHDAVAQLAADLVIAALGAAEQVVRTEPQAGHA